MSNRQKAGVALLGVVALAYMRPDLLERIFPGGGILPSPGPVEPVLPDTHGLGAHLQGIQFRPGDKEKFADMFSAVADAIVADGSVSSPRVTCKDDAADMVAVLMRYNKLGGYPGLTGFVAAMKAAVGSGSEELTDTDRQTIASVYRSASAAFRNLR